MAGGELFETGAGGSAPKHVQQFVEEASCAGIRWASSWPCRIAGSPWPYLQNAKAQVLAKTLDQATAKFLDENKSPARKVGGLDNRGSHYYLAMYWAQAVAAQTEDARCQSSSPTPRWNSGERETRILDELKAAQGNPWTSAATTSWTRPRLSRPCVPAPR